MRAQPCWKAAQRVPGDAVAELLCGFPVYRSYLPEGRDALDTAVSVARTHRPDLADVCSPRSAPRCSPTPPARSPPACSRPRAW